MQDQIAPPADPEAVAGDAAVGAVHPTNASNAGMAGPDAINITKTASTPLRWITVTGLP